MNEQYTSYDYARLFAAQTNQNIFLTGKAGTGKTTFLHQLRETSPKQIAVVAPTGVAAINAGGTTIHSFFQLPFTPFIPSELGRRELIGKMKMQANRRKVLRELELLVIDEISMVRADVLDAIDTVLRHIRHRHNEPFGGVQMIFIGDMYQLSPVVKNDEWQILSQVYSGVYFFHSLVFQARPFVHIEFEKVFRQKDAKFIRLLNEVRDNRLTTESMEMLDACYKPSFIPPADDTYIVLTTHNYKADKINDEELKKIKSSSRVFRAATVGDFPEKSYPAEENLELKVGAKVMFIKNDNETPRRFFNGKIGTIESWDDETIWVQCPDDSEPIEVKPMEWENIRYQVNETTLEVDEEVLGSFRQYPLRLAWAITIHKSQGLTFDKAVIDAEAAFASGQVYVALSRCRSLEGMVLLSRLNQQAIQNDREIVRFSSLRQSADYLADTYTASRHQYSYNLLMQVYDFSAMMSEGSRWLTDTNDVASSFGEDVLDFVRNVNVQIAAIQDVGSKFATQMTQLIHSDSFDEQTLTARLYAASEYFSAKLNTLIETLKESPATTDSRENAKEYDEHLEEIYVQAAKKNHWITGLSDGFNVDKYFDLRRSFDLKPFSVSSYSRKQSKTTLRSKNPGLAAALTALRNQIADDAGLPIFLIAGTRTVVEMADYLPQTKNDLLRIHGFGEAKYEKFGEQFLTCIRNYAMEHGLASAMNDLFDTQKSKKTKEKKEKKEKAKKGDSALLTLQAYRDGSSVEDIAASRNLTIGTICGHLNQFIALGELEVESFVNREKLDYAESLIENASPDVSVYALLKEHFSHFEVSFILGYLRRKYGQEWTEHFKRERGHF